MKYLFKADTRESLHCPHCGMPFVSVTKNTLLIGSFSGQATGYIDLDTHYVVDTATHKPFRFDGKDGQGCIRCANCRKDLSYNSMFYMEDADAAIAKLQEARFAVAKAADLLEGVLSADFEAYAWLVEAQRLLNESILESRPFTLPREEAA